MTVISMDIAGKYFPIASQHADIMEEGLTRIRASMRAYAKVGMHCDIFVYIINSVSGGLCSIDARI
jgi:hypothetical protein